jgi:hypothetical protein
VKLRKPLGFVYELAQAVLELFLLGPLIHGDMCLPRRARGKLAGQVFLDGDFLFQQGIPAYVRDAETAETQHPADDVPFTKDGSRFHVQSFRCFCPVSVAARRADFVFLAVWGHATHADFCWRLGFHKLLSSC